MMNYNQDSPIPSDLTSMMPQPILRLRSVIYSSGLSRSSLYSRMAEGLWPKPVSLGARAVGWPANEVAVLNSARIAGKSNDEIRILVSKLEEERKFQEQ